jgi:mono/diheme cytochrome c family protein
MKRAVLLALAAVASISISSASTPQSAATAANDAAGRGAYLVTLGDCMPCHTARVEEPFAGARPINTPFGMIYSANITPDRQTGIGGWTDEQFYRALHQGIRADGAHLYPAFPYPYFTRMSRADTDAIYAYLMTLKPLRKTTPPNKLPFPFNIRGLIGVWNALNFTEGQFQPNAMKSAEWNRGAYIVTGPGHCGACHTPKNLLGGDERDKGLSGGNLDNWFAANLTQDRRSGIDAWTVDDIVGYLKNGRNARATASGSMQEVAIYSTSHMSDADLTAIATYLKDQTAGGGDREAPAPQMAAMRAGEAIFVDVCTACHRSEGKGVPEFFPPLQGDASVQSRDPTTIIRIVLQGSQSPPTDGRPTPLSMPAFAWKLDDQQIADVVSYIRNSWGNRAPAVQKSAVSDLRKDLDKQQTMPEQPQRTSFRN